MNNQVELITDQIGGYLMNNYTSLELDTFRKDDVTGVEDFISLLVDPLNDKVVKEMNIKKMIEAEPFVVVNSPRGISEALFVDPEDETQYLHFYCNGGAKDQDTLIKMFRSEWVKPLSQNGGIVVEVLKFSPNLNIQLVRLITNSREANRQSN